MLREKILAAAGGLEGAMSFCSGCGNTMTAGERFCRVCGRANTAEPVSAAPGSIPAPPPVVPAGPAETSGKAIVSLISGIFFFILPAAIVAIIFGHLSLSEIRKSAGRLQGHGLAIAGLVLGYLGIAAVPLILIIAAIAIPNLLHARMAVNEASALTTLRTIAAAEINYSSAHPTTGYTCSLSDLAREGMISDNLAGGGKNGYAFELQNCIADASNGPNTKFQVVAYPILRNRTGVRAFCEDESDIIKVDSSGSTQGCTENGVQLQ